MAVDRAVARISPGRIKEAMSRGASPLLVCAYEDILACNDILVPGAIPLIEFKLRADTLNRDQEIVFYCACAGQETAVRRATEYRAKGFARAEALEGEADAWLALLPAAGRR